MKIFVKVCPKSKLEKVEKKSETNFRVRVKEVPEKGKANKAVLRVLADYFNIAESKIRIVSGSTSKIKIIELDK
jgi:hypothetical protein